MPSYQPPTLPAPSDAPGVAATGAPATADLAIDMTTARTVDDELLGLEPWRSYCAAYRTACGEDLADVRELGCVRRVGEDREGYPLYVFLPGNVPADVDLQRVRRYAVRLMHEHTREGRPFSVLFVQNNVNASARALGAWFVAETYWMVPRPMKKNLRTIGVLHPTSFVRTVLLLLAPFLSDSFWDKLYLVERLEFLDDIVGPGRERIEALALPPSYAAWDRELDERAQEDAAALRSGTMFPSAAGMGGAMGGTLFNGMPPAR